MESHVLNSYHQARFRTIGHRRMVSSCDSFTSESSSNHSPEYPQIQAGFSVKREFEESCDDEEQWSQQNVDNNMDVNSTVPKMEDHDSNSEEEEIIFENANEHQEPVYYEHTEQDYIEDNHLVEGSDYDVIQVITINPNSDCDSDCDDPDKEFCIQNERPDDNAYCIGPEINYNYNNNTNTDPCSDLNINLDGPVVSNVDEYFLKENKEPFIELNEPVVKDVDEYFIKPKKECVPDIDKFFVKTKPPEAVPLAIVENSPSVDKFITPMAENTTVCTNEEIVSSTTEPEELKEQPKIPVETKADSLKQIDAIKRFLLDDMTYSKNIQRSCSVPHSPMHIPYVDIDDCKTCLSFEDLNLDLSDLTFESDKDKSTDTANKSDDIPRTLTDEDVNSFLITSKPVENKVKEDNLCLQDMEIETPIESSVETTFIENPITPIKPSTLTAAVKIPIKPILVQKSVVAATKTPVVLPVTRTIVSTAPLPVIQAIKPPKISAAKPAPKSNVLDFCVEKSPKKDVEKADNDDFVDVESCNDTTIPVLEANNLNSLLEQFEATEKLNMKPNKAKPRIITDDKIKNGNGLPNGMRLQDAAVQLNKTKMRQILMPTPTNTTVKRSSSPILADHDYCTVKKRHSFPSIRGGQSLLKPEVLSSNNRILNSRYRSCKNKKIVYNLSSDDESEKCDSKRKTFSDSDANFELKKPVKAKTLPNINNNSRKKLSPVHSIANDAFKDKSNSSVIDICASKASDTGSQKPNCSIKLTIKNKSEVILNCDVKDSQEDGLEMNKSLEKCKPSTEVTVKPIELSKVKYVKHTKDIKEVKECKEVKETKEDHTGVKEEKDIKDLDSNKTKHSNKDKHEHIQGMKIKEEIRPKDDNFYALMFPNKQDVKVPQPAPVKTEKRTLFEEELNQIMEKSEKKLTEHPQKKRKLNIQEYKLRKGANSNNSSATVSPEPIFPDMSNSLNIVSQNGLGMKRSPNNVNVIKVENSTSTPKILYDPIKEASRKILMNTKKQKAEALRKRDEDIVMSKIPKVENLELQPLISDAEMMKIVGMAPPAAEVLPLIKEKPKPPKDFDEIILVSVGVNTDEKMFNDIEKSLSKIAKINEGDRKKVLDPKSGVNFKIKKSEHLLKQNVFDSVKRERKSSDDDKKHSDLKCIDKERFKDITATLKSVEKQVETKISSNSLFASIQDTVMKKAPTGESKKTNGEKEKVSSSSAEKKEIKYIKATIVRDYDLKVEHGEDKIILHLPKDRNKPSSNNFLIQTDAASKLAERPVPVIQPVKTPNKEKSPANRKRNDSDMSMSSPSPVRSKDTENKSLRTKIDKRDDKVSKDKRSRSRDRRSRSKDRYERHRRRSRSRSRSRRRRRSRTRSKSRRRSIDRYRRYRRSTSPYKRRRRSRSPYRSSRRSPSIKIRRTPSPSIKTRKSRSPSIKNRKSRSPSTKNRKSRSPSIKNRKSRSPSKQIRSKTPVKKPKVSPQTNVVEDKNANRSFTPPLRKTTVSESSDTSTSSSSSSSSSDSSSSSSDASRRTRRSCSPFRKDNGYRTKGQSYSSEDREANTPVEERRIVFVGKLEKDITKSHLRSLFSKYGPIIEVRLHSKEDGSRYGFVTFREARDAWAAVEAGGDLPHYDVGFGGRRAFCRHSYADLDGLEAEYTESAFHGQSVLPARRNNDMSFEQMLLDMKKKLSQRKKEEKREENP